MLPLGIISIDMDELSVIAEGAGIRVPTQVSVYHTAVPRLLDLLAEMNLKATFFIITKDVDSPDKIKRLKEMESAGHEIANHSHQHNHLLNMTAQQTREDLEKSTAILQHITGKKIMGYRGPSLTFNKYMINYLREFDYSYDSTVNPSLFFITEWIYHFLRKPSIRNFPQYFFLRHAFCPTKPYWVSSPSIFKRGADQHLLEIPISRVPYFHVPFYATFHFMFPVTYKLFRKLYFSQQDIVYHAHALDFLDLEQDHIPSVFSKHPGIAMPWSQKKEYFIKIFSELKSHHRQIITGSEMAILKKQEKEGNHA